MDSNMHTHFCFLQEFDVVKPDRASFDVRADVRQREFESLGNDIPRGKSSLR